MGTIGQPGTLFIAYVARRVSNSQDFVKVKTNPKGSYIK